MSFEKHKIVKGLTFVLVNKVNGSPITSGTVNGYVTIDGGVQQSLIHTPVHEGKGQWSVNIAESEMNGDVIGLLFTHSNAVAVEFIIPTVEADQSFVTGITTR